MTCAGTTQSYTFQLLALVGLYRSECKVSDRLRSTLIDLSINLDRFKRKEKKRSTLIVPRSTLIGIDQR